MIAQALPEGGLAQGLATVGAPEELQLDVVWVAEREHGVRGVRRLLDPGVPYSQLVQSDRPVVKIAALGNQELQVIEPSLELAEEARLAAVVNQAELNAAMLPGQADQLDVPARLDITAGYLCAKNVAVPFGASLGVPDSQDDDLPDNVWHRPRVTTGSAVWVVFGPNQPCWRGWQGIRSGRDH
jgi:hypothetical protein